MTCCLDKIKSYMESVSVKIPLPVKCTIEERKGKKHAKLHFACQGRGEHCLYKVYCVPLSVSIFLIWDKSYSKRKILLDLGLR